MAHEALIREWPTLREWLAADREALRLHRSLTEAAADWQRANREPSLHFRGARLAAALDWAPAHAAELNDLERDFLEHSSLASEREAQRQRQVNRRLRFLLAGAGVFLVLAIGAGAYAVLEANRAEQAALDARARELTMSALAVMSHDPSLGKALVVAAAGMAEPSRETLELLHRAVDEDRSVARYAWPADREIGNMWVHLHPSGELMLASPHVPLPPNDYMEIFNLTTGSVEWWLELPQEPAALSQAYFTPDGRHVIVGIRWESEEGDDDADMPRDLLGVRILDAWTGELVRHLDVGHCGAVTGGVAAGVALAHTMATESGACVWNPFESVQLESVDLATGARKLVAPRSPVAVMSADGRHAAYDDWTGEISAVVNLETLEPPRCEIPRQPDQNSAEIWSLNHDASLLLYGREPVMVWYVNLCERLPDFTEHAGPANHASFGPGDIAYSTGRDGQLLQWNARTGQVIDRQTGIGNGFLAVNESGMVLASVLGSNTAVLSRPAGPSRGLDVRARADLWRPPVAAACFVLTDGLLLNGNTALMSDVCSGSQGSGTTTAVNIDSMTVRYSLRGTGGQRIALSPDGRRFVRQEAVEYTHGSMTVRDVLSGDELLELHGLCKHDGRPENAAYVAEGCAPYPATPFAFWAWDTAWSPDGSLIASIGDSTFGFRQRAAVWSASGGELVSVSVSDPTKFASSLIFTPDSAQLIVAYYDGSFDSRSTGTWQVTGTGSAGSPLTEIVGFTAEGDLLAIGEGSSLHWITPQTLQPSRPSLGSQQEGSVRAAALSPSGLVLATGSSDGLLRILDALTGRLVFRVDFASVQVKGVAFVDELRVVVALDNGILQIVTVDPSELVMSARSSLTRTFTGAECERFGFEPCPTLEELRSP